MKQLLNWSIGSTLGRTYARASAQVTLLTYTSHQVRSSTQSLWAPHCTQGQTQVPSPAPTARRRLSKGPGPLLLPLWPCQPSLMNSLCFSHISLLVISRKGLKPWALLLYHMSNGCFYCLDCHNPVICLAKFFTSLRSLLKPSMSFLYEPIHDYPISLITVTSFSPWHHCLHSQSPLFCLLFVSPLLSCKFHHINSKEPGFQ